MERPLTVGQLARATGVPTKTIRYYEQVSVLPVSRRSDTGYRHYSRHDVHRLLFIRRARTLGLSLANLKALTAELDGGECLTGGHLNDLHRPVWSSDQSREEIHAVLDVVVLRVNAYLDPIGVALWIRQGPKARAQQKGFGVDVRIVALPCGPGALHEHG